MNARRLVAVAALCCAASGATAQIGGTVFVDFGGFNGTPQGNITALSTSLFPGLVATDLPTLRSSILANMQAAYAPYSINITGTLPSGNFTRVVIGDSGTNAQGALGIANEIDFRNKREQNIVSVVANNHFLFPPTSSTLAGYATMMANTANHELGHVLGLMHSDVVSTYVAAGGGAAGRTAVQNNEIMRAVTLFGSSPNPQPQYGGRTFGEYSAKKLLIATQGVNVQPETAAPTFTSPFAADPARAGDAGGTMATAGNLSFDANNDDVVLGSLNNDADVFKFTVPANTPITTEVYSQSLTAHGGAPSVGRIADPIDAVLDILDSANNVIQTVQYTPAFDFDGDPGAQADAGNDQLIYRFLVPAAGTYGIRVRGGADAVGDYELFVMVPTPGTLVLLGGAGLLAARRRRA